MTFRIESGIPLPPRYPEKDQTCSFCGSIGSYYAKGLCRNCYMRNIKKGTPERSLCSLPAAEQIRRLSKAIGECQIWEGKIKGKVPKLGSRDVRRFLYEERYGLQSTHSEFLPICGNDRCVNPAHLEVTIPLTDQEINAIIARSRGLPKREAAKALRGAGLTLQRIGDGLSVTRERARQLLDHPPPFKHQQMEDRAAKVNDLLKQGLTLAEIRLKLGLKHGAVCIVVKNYIGGFPMEYINQLKSRRDELQAKVDELNPVIEELKMVKAAIAVFEPKNKPVAPVSSRAKGA